MNTAKALLVDKSEESSPKLRLVVARSQVFLSQQALADRAGLDRNVVNNCERGKRIRLASAYRILRAMNPLREELGMPRLKLSDLDWEIYGFSEEELQGK